MADSAVSVQKSYRHIMIGRHLGRYFAQLGGPSELTF